MEMEMEKSGSGNFLLLGALRKKIEGRLKSEEEKIRFQLDKIQNNFRCELRNNKEARTANGNHLADYNSSPSPGNNDLLCQQVENCKKRLWKIKMAIWWLELGRYGICKHCREPIALARLEKIPYTDTCPACKGAGHNGGRR